MQILPTNYNSASGFFDSLTDSSQGSNFMYAMEDALSSVQNGDYVSADAALADEDPLVESPYSKHTTDGVTYTMDEVLFTKQELAELRQQLVKEGAPEEALKQFDILADQPNGATLAQVMASLMGQANTPKFGENDEQAIVAFLGQLDPTGDLAANVLDQMKSGNGAGAFDLIQNALGKLGAMETIDIDIATAMSLGRGLGLNADSLRLLGEGFGGFKSLTLNAAQFDTLMNPAKNQFLTDAANADKLEAALEKTLKPIISKARNRMAKEKEATERESRRVQQSKILIDKTVQGNSREMMNETLAETGKNSEHLKLKDALAANNSQSAVNMAQGQKLADSGQEMGQGSARDKNSDNKNGWKDLLGKVEVKSTINQGPTANPLVYSMLQGQVEEMPAFAQNINLNQQQAFLSQQLANQVEQGMLTAMRDGATRLDLQLHPAELGSMAITLIARNGEVTALIRSEKSETAEMMQRQLDTIRVNLENQGVRVDKIEVQLENHQDTAQQFFDDLGQHNARQENNARQQELGRLRNLAAIRNSGKNNDESNLAQNVHDIGQTARYAGQAVHVVA